MGRNPFWWASHYPSVLRTYRREGEDGLERIEEQLRTKAAAEPKGKFSKSDAAYVPYVPLPPIEWDHRCGRCRFWVDHGPGHAGECMIVGVEGDRWGGQSIHPNAGCALFMPPAGEPMFGWLDEIQTPAGADLVRGEYHTDETSHETKRAERRSGGELRESVLPRGATVDLELVADGFASPIAFAEDEDADRRYIADQSGQVYVHDRDGLNDEPFLDVSDQLVELETLYDERGLLGFALHPEFSENGRCFVHYSAPRRDGTPKNYDHTEVIAEFHTDDGVTADADSERTILEIPHPQFNHNAGPMTFGPDGYLYITMGDGGNEGDRGLGHVRGGNGQDVTEKLLGGILRIDVDDEEDGKPYSIPDDNPLVDEEGRDEYYAWGLRNPWGLSFNDGDLFVADVGQHLFEEVNIVERGGNYGWNVREGFHCFDPKEPSNPPESCPRENDRGEELLDPIVEYPHIEDGEVVGSAVVGGFVAENDGIPELEGSYVFGDWGTTQDKPSGRLFAASPPADGDGRWEMEELAVAGNERGRLDRHVLAFGRGADGDLYVLTNETHVPQGETGAIHRLTPAE